MSAPHNGREPIVTFDDSASATSKLGCGQDFNGLPGVNYLELSATTIVSGAVGR